MKSLFTIVKRAVRVTRVLLRIASAYQAHYLASIFYSEATARARRSRLHRRSAVRIRQAAIYLQGIYIKLGQMMSTRVDLLPDEFTEELSVLQDQVPPVAFTTIQKVIKRDFGASPEDIFSYLSPEPIAAASLGQVHEAYLKADGCKVAVKVQYPDIEQVVAIDLRMAHWVAALLQRWFPHVHFDVLYREFSRGIHDELDYFQEGRNAEKFYHNFTGHEDVVVPKVLWEYCTKHVLTLEFVDGIKINQFDEMRAKGIDLKKVASLLAESYMLQILEHRFFHGDPHPGNLFVQARPNGSPRLVFVDFGQMQSITPGLHVGIKRTIRAVILRDTSSIVRGLVELGFIERGHLHEGIEQAVDFFMTRYRDMKPKEFRNISIGTIAQDVNQLFKISPLLQIPNHFILFARTAMMLNGICSRLDPDLNIIELARPHAERFISSDEGLISQILDSGREIGEVLIHLPRQLDSFLTMAMTQGVRTHMSSQDMTGILTRIYRLAQRGVLAFTIIGLAFLYGHFKQQALQIEALVTAGAIGLTTLILLWVILRDR